MAPRSIVDISGLRITTRKHPIMSEVADEPSPLDMVELWGKDSKKFVSLHQLFASAATSMPAELTTELSKTYTSSTLSQQARYDKMSEGIKDFLGGVKVLRSVGKEEALLPLVELHRPKIDGCTASYKQTCETSLDFSFGIKIFGVGGGVSKGTKYGMSVTTEISGECVQLALPVTINWEECKTSSGRKFLRANVENVGKVLRPLELKTPLDNCTLDKDTVKKAGWQTVTFSVPKATKQNQTLTVGQGQGAEISLQTTIAGAEIGPKAVVKNLKQAEYSYTLVGPHDYLAYLPKNRTTYCWNWYP